VKGHSLTQWAEGEMRLRLVRTGRNARGGELERTARPRTRTLQQWMLANLRTITTSTCACTCTHTCAGTPHRTFQIASDHITSVRRGSPNRRATAQSIDCSDAMKRRTATRAAVFGGYGLWVRFSVKHNIRRKRCQMVTRTTSVHDATHMWRLPMVNLNC